MEQKNDSILFGKSRYKNIIMTDPSWVIKRKGDEIIYVKEESNPLYNDDNLYHQYVKRDDNSNITDIWGKEIRLFPDPNVIFSSSIKLADVAKMDGSNLIDINYLSFLYGSYYVRWFEGFEKGSSVIMEKSISIFHRLSVFYMIDAKYIIVLSSYLKDEVTEDDMLMLKECVRIKYPPAMMLYVFIKMETTKRHKLLKILQELIDMGFEYVITFLKSWSLQHLHDHLTKKIKCVCGLQYNTKKCSGCCQKYYCSSECQKLDWTTHKKNCKSNSAEKTQKDDRNIFHDLGFIQGGHQKDP